MKRILFIMHSMPIGGAEKVLLDILDNFDYNNYKVDLLLYTNDGDLLPKINKEVKIYTIFKRRKRTIWNRCISKTKEILNLTDYIEKIKTRKAIKSKYFRIISFCQGSAHKLHTFLLDKGDKHISWVHSDLSINNWGKLFFHNNLQKQQKAYNQMDCLVFVSEGAREKFIELFNIRNQIAKVVIHNPLNAKNIKKSAKMFTIDKPKNKHLFVNVGRLIEAKAQMRIIESAKILKKQRPDDFEIWIIGEGPLKGELEKAINDNNLNNNIKLLGNKINPYPYIYASDTFILTSKQEGLPLVIGEALILGKPIIATKIVGPTELLGDAQYGMLVDEEIDSIAKAMNEIIDNKELAAYYSAMALKRSKDFDLTHTMAEIYQTIEL